MLLGVQQSGAKQATTITTGLSTDLEPRAPISRYWAAWLTSWLLDFEMILCHALSAQSVGAAQEYKMDPVKLANIIHTFTLKFIEKTK